jgi:phosphotransferase system enzyme I (PtsI)
MGSRFVIGGTGAARGMALGRARLARPSQPRIDERPLAENEIEPEVERLRAAMAQARDELRALREKLHGALAHEVGEFIDAHNLILDDPELTAGLFTLIRKGHYRAGAALKMQRDRLAAAFDAIDDAYMRSRREDIDHVIGRVQATLNRDTTPAERQIATRVGTIHIGESIAPAEIAHLHEFGVLGVVVTGSSPLSHSAILARSMRLPMVVGAHAALTELTDDDLLLIDGTSGEVIAHPTAQDLARYRQYQREQSRTQEQLARFKQAPSLTADGTHIHLFANAEMPADLANARACGAEGVGLYRTEFLFLQRRELPDEEEQLTAYRNLVLAMGGAPVTIRTLDLGADKADATGLALTQEPNPALGVRGVRLALRRADVFATQIRAILRAGAFGPVRILVPMITRAEEMTAVRSLIASCARDLRSEGHEIADHFDLGGMIEVPAAAIALPGLIRHLDFIAIGTNDLTQYTLAVDRNNDALGDLYDPLHPAVIKLLAQIIAIGARAKKPVTLCGEMAGDARCTPLLLALGLSGFSMHPGSLLEVRQAIASCHLGRLRKLAARLLRAQTHAGIERVLAQA